MNRRDGLPSYADLLARTDAPPGSSWGIFGADDDLGTLNFLTPGNSASEPPVWSGAARPIPLTFLWTPSRGRSYPTAALCSTLSSD